MNVTLPEDVRRLAENQINQVIDETIHALESLRPRQGSSTEERRTMPVDTGSNPVPAQRKAYEPNKTCPVCGKQFWSNSRKLCSAACAEKAVQAKRPQKKCIQCGKDYQPNRGQQRICSDECRKARYHVITKQDIQTGNFRDDDEETANSDAFLPEPEPVEPDRTKSYAQYLADARKRSSEHAAPRGAATPINQNPSYRATKLG